MQPLLQRKSYKYFTSSTQCACAILSRVACLALQYFFTLSHKRHNFRKYKELLNIKCVLGFSLKFLPGLFIILRRNERNIINNVCTLSFMHSTRYCCPSLMKLEFSRQTLEYYSNIKFQENPSSGSRVVPRGQK